MRDIRRRLDKIEERLIPDEMDVVPVVIICRDSRNDRGKGVMVIGGNSEKQGNEQETIETD